MEKNPFAPAFTDLPDILPIFPLKGVLLLPCGQLPLNIFEPRYLAMIEDALTHNRLIGIIQPKQEHIKDIKDDTPVYDLGCAGKITEFSETRDGRYNITLTGIARFNIQKEKSLAKGYRRIKPNWNEYKEDLDEKHCLDIDRNRLKDLLQRYFYKEGMDCDWKAVDDAPDGKLITCLSMVCPFKASEKQALLEAQCCKTRAQMFMSMLEISVCDSVCASHH